MADAEVGDDVYGEDPTVRRLEEQTAERLGLPAGLFVTSGTLGNQLAIGVHCLPGDELFAEASSHCLFYEGGACSALWGVQPRMFSSERGIFTWEQVRPNLRSEDIHAPRSRMLALENTHNRGGGSVWPLEDFRDVAAAAHAAGLKVHLDGARLFNAEVASKISASEFSKLTDSTTVCFSKGLGAPVGSVLCGSVDFIREARRLRKRLGGGMRQAGILAAAALFALHHNVERLAQDHLHARHLAEGLASMPGVSVDLARVETNLVYADVPGAAGEWVARLKKEGVLVNPSGLNPRSVRLACHLDVSAEDVEQTLKTFRRLLGDRN